MLLKPRKAFFAIEPWQMDQRLVVAPILLVLVDNMKKIIQLYLYLIVTLSAGSLFAMKRNNESPCDQPSKKQKTSQSSEEEALSWDEDGANFYPPFFSQNPSTSDSRDIIISAIDKLLKVYEEKGLTKQERDSFRDQLLQKENIKSSVIDDEICITQKLDSKDEIVERTKLVWKIEIHQEIIPEQIKVPDYEIPSSTKTLEKPQKIVLFSDEDLDYENAEIIAKLAEFLRNSGVEESSINMLISVSEGLKNSAISERLLGLQIFKDCLAGLEISEASIKKAMNKFSGYTPQIITNVMNAIIVAKNPEVELLNLCSKKSADFLPSQDLTHDISFAGSSDTYFTPGFKLEGHYQQFPLMLISMRNTSMQGQGYNGQHPLIVHFIASGMFDEAAVKNIPEKLLAYPTKALAHLGIPIEHPDMAEGTINVGIKNFNQDDCFMLVSIQVLSQMEPFLNALKQAFLLNKSGQFQNDLHKETLVFIGALRSNGHLIYDFLGNASAIMRKFLTCKRENNSSIIPSPMAFGQQCACEFFQAWLHSIIGNDEELRDIFSINLLGKIRLSKDTLKTIEERLEIAVPEERLNQSESLFLALGITGNSLNDCLDSYFAEEMNRNIYEWGQAGKDDFKLSEKGIAGFGSRKLYLTAPFPPILTIQLQRFRILDNNRVEKINEPTAFPMHLDLKEYAENTAEQSPYSLIGVIFHYGNSTQAGHYWAYTRDCYSGAWYKYDNEKRISIDEVSMEVMGEIGFDGDDFDAAEKATPYLLFYQKI